MLDLKPRFYQSLTGEPPLIAIVPKYSSFFKGGAVHDNSAGFIEVPARDSGGTWGCIKEGFLISGISLSIWEGQGVQPASSQ